MTFAYSEYLINNLVLPLFALAFIAVPVGRMIISVIGHAVRGEGVNFGDAKTVLLLILMIVVAVILCNILISGHGYCLIGERASDAVTAEGTIEQIQPLSIFSSPKYTASGESSNGYAITIDGTTCTSMALGTLEVGDQVTVTYMPNSGYILSIQEMNP